MMHELGLIFVLTSRNPLMFSYQCIVFAAGRIKKTIVLYVCLFYQHLPISGENLYGSVVDNFFITVLINLDKL
jgi:hypothetical protein